VRIIMRTKPPLCEGCRFGLVTRAETTRVFCDWMKQRVAPDIESCSQYSPISVCKHEGYAVASSYINEPRYIDPRPTPGQYQ
jgi:hypothetical protein